MKLLYFSIFFFNLFLKTSPILQKSRNAQCFDCQPKISLGSSKRIPVYVPIPIFTLYQIPILHHYPLNQVIQQITPIPIEIPVEHRINKPYAIPIPVEQKILIPEAVPYGVKVPILIPINNGTKKNSNESDYQNNGIHLNNIVQQTLKTDFDKLNLVNSNDFPIGEISDIINRQENSTKIGINI